LRDQISDLRETRDALLAETTTLSARTRIESIAATHLGLRPITDKQRRRLPDASASDQPPVEETTPRAPGEDEQIARSD
jgi:hypothetical protein